MTQAPNFRSHLRSILSLPFMVVIIFPGLIYWFSKGQALFQWLNDYRIIFIVFGIVFLVLGFFLFFSTIKLFHKKGKGTLAPWDPPKHLVITGTYRYVRNPMISGVNAILLAEAFLLPSGYILCWQLFFFTLNHVYFILKEEPALEKRFGLDYKTYQQNVPRWIPRWTPWKKE